MWPATLRVRTTLVLSPRMVSVKAPSAFLLIGVAVIAAFITAGIFLIRALSRYIKSGNVRKEKSSIRKSLGEVLKQHREECKMTQEFVAESIGVSRQAVSKWETGASDPSTSNLLTLAKLFNTTAEELLREVQ